MSATDRDLRNASAFIRGDHRENRPRRIFAVCVFVLLFVVLLAAIVSATGVYRSVAAEQEQQSDQRVGLNLIANYVRASDVPDAVARGEGPEGDALVLVDRQADATYETRIYRWQGSIVEEYAIAGSLYTPEKAQALVTSDTFSFDYDDGLLTITTDQGSTSVALRSTQGNA
jgi:hypothetical protein